MVIDSTFWVAVSFVIFFGGLIYLKVPQKINTILNKLISDIKNEIDESEKLRSEAKILLDNACLLYTSPSPRDMWTSRMPSSA